ncbi:response regulator [Novosphingobium sp.]|uniref:response regulator transcription factor n=1 Tax=Novosphingobium sp. TaxID=1874826 RepID=UPI0031D689D7
MESAPSDKPLVLIVDDDDDLREALSDLFTSVGLDSLAFPSTAALLAHGLPDRPSCMVLDLRMPGSSGLDLQARLVETGVKLPIIFLTGYADVPTSVRAMKAGAVDFLPKPFREQELLDAVMSALERDRERWAGHHAARQVHVLAKALTPRETDVLKGVKRGLLNKQIAYELGITEITVKMHRSSAGRKLKANSVADLVMKLDILGW